MKQSACGVVVTKKNDFDIYLLDEERNILKFFLRSLSLYLMLCFDAC